MALFMNVHFANSLQISIVCSLPNATFFEKPIKADDSLNFQFFLLQVIKTRQQFLT